MKKPLVFTDTEYGTYIGRPGTPEPLSEEHAIREAVFLRDNPEDDWAKLKSRMLGYLSPLVRKAPNAKLVEPPGDVPVMRNTATGHEVASADGTFDLWEYGKMVKHSCKLKEAIRWLQ